MNDGILAVTLVAVGLAAGVTRIAVRAVRAADDPDGLVAQLRLAQLTAVVLAFVAGASLGFTAVNAGAIGAGFDAALGLGFFVVAATAMTRDPREGLTLLALAFAAHALVDILHRPGALPRGQVPQWYLTGCATYNLYMAALCYWPIFRRPSGS